MITLSVRCRVPFWMPWAIRAYVAYISIATRFIDVDQERATEAFGRFAERHIKVDVREAS